MNKEEILKKAQNRKPNQMDENGNGYLPKK